MGLAILTPYAVLTYNNTVAGVRFSVNTAHHYTDVEIDALQGVTKEDLQGLKVLPLVEKGHLLVTEEELKEDIKVSNGTDDSFYCEKGLKALKTRKVASTPPKSSPCILALNFITMEDVLTPWGDLDRATHLNCEIQFKSSEGRAKALELATSYGTNIIKQKHRVSFICRDSKLKYLLKDIGNSYTTTSKGKVTINYSNNDREMPKGKQATLIVPSMEMVEGKGNETMKFMRNRAKGVIQALKQANYIRG